MKTKCSGIMRPTNFKFRYPFVLTFVLLSVFYSCEANISGLSSDINLVASTPGDGQVKSILAITPDTKIDFIRWNLTLRNTKANKRMFLLGIAYGESQPNTTGFKNNGSNKSIEGEYDISHESGSINGAVYHLTSTQLPTEILIVKLSDNIFHLLTSQKGLMVGNGGWSYTLNRRQQINNVSADLPATILSNLFKDTTQQMIFEGRTPCLDFAQENNISVAPNCFKLKWKLILNKDPKTLQPANYILRRTNSRENNITGKWIIKRASSNAKAVIYQLDPDKPGQSISLLVGDENVAFFLNKDNHLFIGNEDFSYTLNKRQEN